MSYRRKIIVPFRVQVIFWTLLSAASILIIATRFEMTVDLGYFLPPPTTDQERVLVDRLGQGPGSRLLFISVPLSIEQDAEAIRVRLKNTILDSKLFSNVFSGDLDISVTSIPADIRLHRYLLADIDLSTTGLRAALLERRADMAIVADDDLLSLMAEDPYLASVTTLEKLAWSDSAGAINWTSPDGLTIYLIAETIAPAFDMAAQKRAVDTINTTVTAILSQKPKLHGVGAYGVELQDVIKTEAQQRSVVAVLAIAIILLLAYRRWQVIWLTALPLSIGALAGLAAVSLLFGRIHGITLAFGFTLFGVAVDYPLHLLSHMRRTRSSQSVASTWPTIRLGAFSTIIAYLALTISGSTGLAQLGVFSATGILVSLYATRSLLPALVSAAPCIPASPKVSSMNPPEFRHTFWIAALLTGVAIVVLLPRSVWNNDLSSMTPIAPEKLLRDRELRLDLGAPDIRYLLTVSAPTQEGVLQKTERLKPLLEHAQAAHWLDRYQLVTALAPSLATQEQRHARIVEAAENKDEMQQVMRDLLLRPEAFQSFLDDLRRAANSSDRVSTSSLKESSLQDLVNSHVYFDGDHWVSIATLVGLHAPELLAKNVAEGIPGATLVDLKGAAESLVENYRMRVLLLLGIAFSGIIVFLYWRVGMGARLLWVCGTLLAAVCLTGAVTAMLLGALSLFSLFAVVLVSGLGLDYALFASRTETDTASRQDTLHALTICASSTLLAFLILGFSSVPILQAIGVTVAIGVSLSFLLTLIGVRQSSISR